VLLNEAQNLAAVQLHPWLLAPILPVVIVVLAFNFLGDGLRRQQPGMELHRGEVLRLVEEHAPARHRRAQAQAEERPFNFLGDGLRDAADPYH
jgi:hypothetical protein